MERQGNINDQAPHQPTSLVSPPPGDNESLIWQTGKRTLPPLWSPDPRPGGGGPAEWHNTKRSFPPNHLELPPLDTGQGLQPHGRASHLSNFERSDSTKRRRVDTDRTPPPPRLGAYSPFKLNPNLQEANSIGKWSKMQVASLSNNNSC
jgi:hypothetical protein